MLQLTRPLVFIDIESTGLDRQNDRIVQIALHKVFSFDDANPIGHQVNDDAGKSKHDAVLTYYVNPEREIPQSSTIIHGITNEDVCNCPTFEEICPILFDFVKNCDLAGFNSNWFDIPMLFHHFLRAGIHWDISGVNLIDVGNLFKIKQPRTLANALSFYCGREMKNAHSAVVDVSETVAVFRAQLEQYADLPKNVAEMALFTNYGAKIADLSGKFYYDAENNLRFNFGKHKGELVTEHIDFCEWMLYRAVFAYDTNVILQKILNTEIYGDDDLF